VPTEALEDLTSVMRSLGIPLGQVCIVGSTLLELAGLRAADDLDIIVHPDAVEANWSRIQWGARRIRRGAINFTTNIAHGTCRYGPIGLRNSDVFDDRYSRSGTPRTARVEVEYALKCRRGEPKDVSDTGLVEAAMASQPGWDSELVQELLTNAPVTEQRALPRLQLLPWLMATARRRLGTTSPHQY
jgi:hypothetical protein